MLAFDSATAQPLLSDNFEGATKITIDSPAGPLEGWFWPTQPDTSMPAAAVVLLHGCSGVYGSNGYGDESHVSSRFSDWARRLNAAGMHALLVDSFSTRDPHGPPSQARQNYCGDRAATVAIGATEEYDRPADALAAYDTLTTLRSPTGAARVDPARVAVVGWSHGGSAALAIAAMDADAQPFMLAQAFYPGCGLYGAFGNAAGGVSSFVATIPLDLYLGDEDTIGMPSTCTTHATHSANAGGADMDITVFDAVGHSFDGASCDERADGPLLSPWSGKRYACSGGYNGKAFDLDDYRAALESRRQVACALGTAFGLDTAPCEAPPPLP